MTTKRGTGMAGNIGRQEFVKDGLTEIVLAGLRWMIAHPEEWDGAGHRGNKCECNTPQDCTLLDMGVWLHRQVREGRA